MPETPEQKARREIDAKLVASGWLVQDRDDADLTAGRGIAIREFPMKSGFGFADYLLYLYRKAMGAVEAKADGNLLLVAAMARVFPLPDVPHRTNLAPGELGDTIRSVLFGFRKSTIVTATSSNFSIRFPSLSSVMTGNAV
jgi:hypothetical protein